MNILVTGASRGIGAAAFALLRSTGHQVVGHSTRGGGELIAADLADPDAPRALWDAALERLGGRIDVLVNNAGIYGGVADDAADGEWHAAWARTLPINLPGAGRPVPARRRAISASAAAGRIVNVASRAAYRGDSPQHWHYAASKAAHGRHDQDHRPRLCGRGHLRLRRLPRLHRVRDGRGISGRPRRRGDRRRHSARPRRQHRRSGRGDPLAGDRCARLRDRHGDRRQRRQLCPR